MNKTKAMIRNFVILPMIVYLSLIYAFLSTQGKGFIGIDRVTNYWSNYLEVLKFHNTNSIDLSLLSNYFVDYSLFLDPSLLVFNNTYAMQLFTGFPILIPMLYLIPISYIPILFIHRRKKYCCILLLALLLFTCFLGLKLIMFNQVGIEQGLLKSVKEVRLDNKWYEKSSLLDKVFNSGFIRKTRSKGYIKTAIHHQKSHDLLLAWYYLQKAKQTGLYFEDLNQRIEEIELSLIREYKIQKFYQFLK